jgi:hypothetical protein
MRAWHIDGGFPESKQRFTVSIHSGLTGSQQGAEGKGENCGSVVLVHASALHTAGGTFCARHSLITVWHDCVEGSQQGFGDELGVG